MHIRNHVVGERLFKPISEPEVVRTLSWTTEQAVNYRLWTQVTFQTFDTGDTKRAKDGNKEIYQARNSKKVS